MKILITGGAGFIGSHLLEALSIPKNELLVFDNFLTGKKENLITNNNINFVEDDFGNYDSLNLIKEFNPEVCFHLAAQSSVVVSVNDPLLDFEHNILQPVKLLKTLHNTDCKKIVFTSSGGTIFGEPDIVPTSEEDFANEPQSPYGVNKKKLNEIIKSITLDSKLSYSILNLSNVYGPRQDPHGEAGVVSIFASKILKKEMPIIYGDGLQTRDYIYVKDVVNALLLSSKEESNLFLNIGTGVETSVNTLLEIIKYEFSSDINPIYQNSRIGELKRSVLNSSAARKKIGWEAQVSINEGIREVANWLKG